MFYVTSTADLSTHSRNEATVYIAQTNVFGILLRKAFHVHKKSLFCLIYCIK